MWYFCFNGKCPKGWASYDFATENTEISEKKNSKCSAGSVAKPTELDTPEQKELPGFICRTRQFCLHLLPGFSCLSDRAFIFDGSDVTRIFIQDDSFQHATHDLAAACLWQHADKVYFADNCDWSEFTANGFKEFLLQLGGWLASML